MNTSTVKAYRYARYSHSRQAEGMSLERQADAAEAWAKAHGLVIDDTHAPFVDEGVSASRGKNLVKGAFSRFMSAVEAGDVPAGSYLLVESVSRFSRLLPQDSGPVLRKLVERDGGALRVVFLDTGMEVNADNLGDIQIGMIFQVLAYVASHYSKDLRGFKLKAWGKARGEMRSSGKVATRMLPFWLTCPATTVDGRVQRGTIAPHPVYAPIVERIFREYVAGRGKAEIAARLQADGVPTPARVGTDGDKAIFWRHGLIGRVLANEAVTGRFQPMIEVRTAITLKVGIAGALKRKRTQDGAPVEGYYPRIISDELFAQAAQLRESKRAHAGARIGGHGEKTGTDAKGEPVYGGIKHILARLATCPVCGAAMLRKNRGPSGGVVKYVCSRAVALSVGSKQRSERDVPTCPRVYVPVADVERALIDNAERLCADAPVADPALQARLESIGEALSAVTTESANLADDIAGMVKRGERVSSAVNRILSDLEARGEELDTQYAQLQSKATAASSNVLRQRVANLSTALQFYGSAFDSEPDIEACNAALYECFSHVVIDYRLGQLECHWRHGPPPSVVRYAEDSYPDLGKDNGAP